MPKPSKPIPEVVCDYCGNKAVLKLSSGHLYDGIDYGPVWECRPCRAWVGCHKNSKRYAPKGRLADAELRKLRRRAHKLFDSLWQRKMRRDGCSQSEARTAAYRWLASALEIKNAGRDCHIGKFDNETCEKTIDICSNPMKNVAKSTQPGGTDGPI